MRLIEYITGSRRGREANRLEREAMCDPFLADAMQGYDAVEADHSGRVERLLGEVRLRSRNPSKTVVRRRLIVGWSAAAVLLAGASATLLYIYSPWIGRDGDSSGCTPALAVAVPCSGEEIAEDIGADGRPLGFSGLSEANGVAASDRCAAGSAEGRAVTGQEDVFSGLSGTKSGGSSDRCAAGSAEDSRMPAKPHACGSVPEVCEGSEDGPDTWVSVDKAGVDSRTLAVVSASPCDSATSSAAVPLSSPIDASDSVYAAASAKVSRYHSAPIGAVEKGAESDGGGAVPVPFHSADSLCADPVAVSASVAVVASIRLSAAVEDEALSEYGAAPESPAHGGQGITVGALIDHSSFCSPACSIAVCSPAAPTHVSDSVAVPEEIGTGCLPGAVSASKKEEVQEWDLEMDTVGAVGAVKRRNVVGDVGGRKRPKAVRAVPNRDVLDALSVREIAVSVTIPDSIVVVYDYPWFKDYCESMWKAVHTRRKDLATGTVVIEFIVNGDGTPADIQIVSGVSPEVNQEALKIMLAWPFWESGGKRRIRVVMECR